MRRTRLSPVVRPWLWESLPFWCLQWRCALVRSGEVPQAARPTSPKWLVRAPPTPPTRPSADPWHRAGCFKTRSGTTRLASSGLSTVFAIGRVTLTRPCIRSSRIRARPCHPSLGYHTLAVCPLCQQRPTLGAFAGAPRWRVARERCNTSHVPSRCMAALLCSGLVGLSMLLRFRQRCEQCRGQKLKSAKQQLQAWQAQFI